MKLVIGTRHFLGSDWTHLDADRAPLISDDGEMHFPDLIGDARHIHLPDQSCTEVFSSECLEHFAWADSEAVVGEWARLVEPGGELRVEVPDFVAACQQLLTGDSLELDLAMQQIIFGGQVNQWDFHYAGITHRTLPLFMTRAGLTIVEVSRGWEVGWLRVRGKRE